jgi:RNA polymerase sigma-70 factor (ECF subfamily)
MSTADDDDPAVHPAPAFQPTRWSLIVAAARHTSPESQAALATLCEQYWPAVYAYLRRRGYNLHDALDLTQGFFALLLDKNYLGDADPAKGRFRTFLLTSVGHFLSNQRDHARAKKRGGGATLLSLNLDPDDPRLVAEPQSADTPEQTFERRWALTMLATALDELRCAYELKGRGALFDQLEPCLTSDADERYREIAQRLATTEAAIKQQVYRLRRRYRQQLRDLVAQTVATPAEIDDELNHIRLALAR